MEPAGITWSVAASRLLPSQGQPTDLRLSAQPHLEGAVHTARLMPLSSVFSWRSRHHEGAAAEQAVHDADHNTHAVQAQRSEGTVLTTKAPQGLFGRTMNVPIGPGAAVQVAVCPAVNSEGLPAVKLEALPRPEPVEVAFMKQLRSKDAVIHSLKAQLQGLNAKLQARELEAAAGKAQIVQLHAQLARQQDSFGAAAAGLQQLVGTLTGKDTSKPPTNSADDAGRRRSSNDDLRVSSNDNQRGSGRAVNWEGGLSGSARAVTKEHGRSCGTDKLCGSVKPGGSRSNGSNGRNNSNNSNGASVGKRSLGVVTKQLKKQRWPVQKQQMQELTEQQLVVKKYKSQLLNAGLCLHCLQTGHIAVECMNPRAAGAVHNGPTGASASGALGDADAYYA